MKKYIGISLTWTYVFLDPEGLCWQPYQYCSHPFLQTNPELCFFSFIFFIPNSMMKQQIKSTLSSNSVVLFLA